MPTRKNAGQKLNKMLLTKTKKRYRGKKRYVHYATNTWMESNEGLATTDMPFNN